MSDSHPKADVSAVHHFLFRACQIERAGLMQERSLLLLRVQATRRLNTKISSSDVTRARPVVAIWAMPRGSDDVCATLATTKLNKNAQPM